MEKNFYVGNRRGLFDIMEDGVAVLSSGYRVNKSADENYDFQVNTNFYYLTGITQPQTQLVIIKNGNSYSERLYIDAYDEMYEKWCGYKLTKSEAAEICGVKEDDIYYNDEFEAYLHDVISSSPCVYFDLEKRDEPSYVTFGLKYAEKFCDKNVRDVYPLVISLRVIKQPCEIEAFKSAIEVTRQGIERLMRKAKGGMYEYQLEAEFDYVAKTSGNKKYSFKTIAAAGENATTLHYTTNDSVIGDGDLILFDLGTREQEYCADISRTFPACGKFSPLQKTIYQIVLDANKKIIEVAKAGMTILELQQITIDMLADGCLRAGLIKNRDDIKKYYFHSVSHSIGLDCHDPNDRKKPLPEGAVISDEPGLYFPEHKIGVRIEDDLLICKDRAINLSESIIKEVREIEDYMAFHKE